jgi:hypothetical protein
MYRYQSIRVSLIGLGVLGLVASCGGGDSTGIADACNPVGEAACLMPWPSSAYLIADATTETGYRVDIPVEAMPTNTDNRTVDSAVFNTYDGFAVAGPILAAFSTGVSADGLPPHTDPGASLAADSSVVIVNMDTGNRLIIFAEVDMNANDPTQRALIIRPLERMIGGDRYAVAIRKSVKAADGSPLPISPGFAAAVDGDSFDHPLMERFDYEAIFTALEATGVARDDLVLAWDFVVASDEFLTSDVLAMREQALPAMGVDGVNLTFDLETNTIAPERAYRFYVGTYDVPMFLDAGMSDPSILVRDVDGVPELNGTFRANIAALIPPCVTTAELPLKTIIFGHGLFGDGEDSLDSGLLQDVAEENCAVILAGDFVGLTGDQLATVAFAMNDVNKAQGITEKLAQGIINYNALARIARGPLADSDEFSYEGNPIIDPTRVYYFGASLGGNMGVAYMSYDPDVLLGVVGVAGGPWSLMFERSLAWPPLRAAVKGSYAVTPWDYQQVLSLMGMLFEKVDLITTAHRLIADPLPDTPPKQILHYMAMGDTLVSNIASDVLVRTLAVPIVGPSLRVPYGASEDNAPLSSGVTIYDENVEPWPALTNVAPDDDNGTHGDVHERAAVRRQLKHFIETGEVRNECWVGEAQVACDCATGACD